MSLLLAQVDGTYQLVRRRGVFAVERACADSDHHLAAAVKAAQEKMIAGLAKRGYEFVGPEFELRGPLPHVSYSEDVTPDSGPDSHPDPRDLHAMAKYEQAERARVAQQFDLEGHDRVDFELVANFKRRALPTFRAI